MAAGWASVEALCASADTALGFEPEGFAGGLLLRSLGRRIELLYCVPGFDTRPSIALDWATDFRH
jgi:hypothetical protein